MFQIYITNKETMNDEITHNIESRFKLNRKEEPIWTNTQQPE